MGAAEVTREQGLLKGKVAAITGAGSGAGRAMACSLPGTALASSPTAGGRSSRLTQGGVEGPQKGDSSMGAPKPPPLGPIVATLVAILSWLVFILLYALFWSNGLSLFQNVIVTLVSFAITGLGIGLMWVIWGSRRSWRFQDYRWDFEKQ